MESTCFSLDHHGYHQIFFPSSMQASFQCLWLQDSSKELHSIFIKSSKSKPPWFLMSTILTSNPSLTLNTGFFHDPSPSRTPKSLKSNQKLSTSPGGCSSPPGSSTKKPENWVLRDVSPGSTGIHRQAAPRRNPEHSILACIA